MKKRLDYVTNSSSSSFIIDKKNLDQDQINAIHMHSVLGAELDIMYANDSWEIQEDDKYITGYTFLDNFSFEEFFRAIGVSDSIVRWDDTPFYLTEICDDEENEENSQNQNSNWREHLHALLERGH